MEKEKQPRHWATEADAWIQWVRQPGHDAFWHYRDTLIGWLGKGNGKALEIGCGEGRVSREMKKLGYHVTASDPIPALVEAAKALDSANAYAICDAEQLPFEKEQFDLVMAYNLLMSVKAPFAVLIEAQRVLKPGGTLFISVTHPFQERGCFEGEAADAPFVARENYFYRGPFEAIESRDGLTMRFAGWQRPLEDYFSALEKAGLAVTALLEPVPSPDAKEGMNCWRRVPLFLWMKAKRLA